MSNTTEVRALRQMGFPGFPDYANICEAEAEDREDGVAWTCTRHPGHDGPHMGTYWQPEEDCETVGFAWIEEG